MNVHTFYCCPYPPHVCACPNAAVHVLCGRKPGRKPPDAWTCDMEWGWCCWRKCAEISDPCKRCIYRGRWSIYKVRHARKKTSSPTGSLYKRPFWLHFHQLGFMAGFRYLSTVVDTCAVCRHSNTFILSLECAGSFVIYIKCLIGYIGFSWDTAVKYSKEANARCQSYDLLEGWRWTRTKLSHLKGKL